MLIYLELFLAQFKKENKMKKLMVFWCLLLSCVALNDLQQGWFGFGMEACKDEHGYVFLSGGGESGRNPSPTIFYLPEGFRPDKDKLFLNAIYEMDPQLLQIGQDGRVSVNTGPDSYHAFFLDGIIYQTPAPTPSLLRKKLYYPRD